MIGSYYKQQWETVYTDQQHVKCDDSGEHPLVYYTVPEGGEAQCGYCNKKWIRK